MEGRISVAGVARRDGAVLVMRRLPGGSVGGLWEFPGGKTEEGETPRDALIREWAEETGLAIAVGDEIQRSRFRHNGEPFTLITFNVLLPSEDSEPELREHDAFMWIEPKKLADLPMVKSDRYAAETISRETA